jgi:polysaccharide chain length determinant protein (PEP-CTERM system associated)
MEERSLHLLDYVGVLKRRRRWLVIPIVAATLVGVALAILLPRTYESYTTLAVTSPSLSSDVLRSGQPDLAERLRAISHELLSRPVLERVAREEGLAQESSIDSAVNAIRSRTEVSLPKALAPAGRTGPDTFVVTYLGPTPEMTQRITNRLATVFVDEHSKIREARAEDTAAFLAAQLSQSQARLRTVEEKLRKVKEAFMGRLPEQMQANLQMASGLRQQQETTSLSLRNEQDRLSMIERQIEAMKQGAAEAPVGKGPGGPSAKERLAILRNQLAEASAMYTEKHPEVQRLQSDIVAAEADVKLEASRSAADRAPALNNDPVYRGLLNERDTSRLRIRELERANSRASAEISRYQARVEAAPMIEEQLGSLNREYELEKQQYNGLSERHQAALMAEDVERRRAGEQFAVLYPAFLPSEPKSPNVLRLLLVSVLGGLVLGGVLAMGREYLDRSVYDARTLQDEFELPVLAEIPRIAIR